MATEKPFPPIHIGMELPKTAQPFIGKNRFTALAVINAILRIKFVNAAGKAIGKVFISAQGMVVQLSGVGSDSGAASLPGEWTLDHGPYSQGEYVVITGGLNAGYYVSLYDDNTTEPFNSVLWKQLANNSPTGIWS